MTPAKRSLNQILDSLSQQDILRLLAAFDQRKLRIERLEALLHDRFSRLVAEPEPMLTAGQAAKRLNVSRGRVYELVRQRKLAKVVVGTKQVRIPISALHSLPLHAARTKADCEAVP